MPCFNSQRTVRQAVHSIFQQELEIPFEIIMVNDGSTDKTASVLVELKKKYSHIRLLNHKRNMGGGKTRNDAILKSKGNLLFCLDSDDILPPHMLPKLIATLDEKNCDGVLFQETHYFMWSTKLAKVDKNKVNPRKPITIENLFSRENSFFTQVNFLYTRNAFDKTGGYPENHGFDTQGFGFRFLAQGNSVYICPNSYYCHRQGVGKSYFEREYEKGRLSLNRFLIFEDLLYLFSDQIILEIFRYDAFSFCNLTSNNLMSYLKNRFTKLGARFFSGTYSWDERISIIEKKKTKSLSDLVLMGTYEFLLNNQEEAFKNYHKLFTRGESSPLLTYAFFRCVASSRNVPGISVVDLVSSITLRPQKSIVSQALPLKLVRYVSQVSQRIQT